VRRFNVLGDELEAHAEPRPGYCRRARRMGAVVGGERIGGTLYELAADERVCPYHFHHGVEEWLYVVSGAPTTRTPAGERTLRAGDVVCFPAGPEGAHDVRGPGRVLILSTNRWPSISVYPDSDKLGARPSPAVDDPDRLNFRRGDAVDYWEGER
jgi:uncharacterized cupin superfamily protein